MELRQGNSICRQPNRDLTDQELSAFVRVLFLPAQDLVDHFVSDFVKFIQVIGFRGRFL